MTTTMTQTPQLPDDVRALTRSLTTDILSSLKTAFVGKDEIVDLLGVSLVSGEHLFLLGPPGTAKSAIVNELARRIDGHVFDYLLTRFTEPNELFGPFDIRRLREGDLVTNTEGMLPEADLVFLDELLNANSAILNSLLLVLNERVFRRGRETRNLPLLMVVGASNHLPEDSALAALFDRFLMRVRCDNVADERLADVLTAGWRLDAGQRAAEAKFAVEDVRRLQRALVNIDLTAVREHHVAVVNRLRKAGIAVSDRRAVKLQRLIAASALLSGRATANITDLWVLRYIWDTDEQREIIASIVQHALSQASETETASAHPRSANQDAPNADELMRDLDLLASTWKNGDLAEPARSSIRDQLGLLSGRCQWISDRIQREHVERRVSELWKELGTGA